MSPYVCWVCWDIEQQSRHSEPGKNIQKILLEAQHNASYKETLYYLWLWLQTSGSEQMQTEAYRREHALEVVPT